jgi:glycosyltransferase involved in cell wall biosynthesis
VVTGLVSAQRALGIDAQVLCGDGAALTQHLAHWRAQSASYPPGTVHTVAGASLLGRRQVLIRWLHSHLQDFDIVHVHSLWRLVPTVAADTSRLLGRPYLIAPHTAMSHWALSQKRTKKALARWLIWNRIWRGAAGFHALNELEGVEIRDCFGRDPPPIFVVPNGVALEEYAGTPEAGQLADRLSNPAGAAPFVLFLARLHTMKGPDLLLQGFAQVAATQPSLQLVFAGPDYGMLTALRAAVAAHDLGSRVHFLGLVSGAERLWLLHNAMCVCQPSRDEGFSLTILEALACARPVVISDRCKFPQVAAAGAGVVVPLAPASIAAALNVYAADPVRRAGDGARARALCESSYSLRSIAERTAAMYAEALAGNGAPDVRHACR